MSCAQNSGRRRLLGVAAVVALAWWAGSAGAAASPPARSGTGADGLRVLSVDRSGLPEVDAIAVAPAMLSELSLPSAAFSVRRGDQRLPTTATRLADGHLEVVLVLDRAVSAVSLRAEQAAATELIHSLPDRVPVHVFDDETVGIPDVGRSDAEASLADTARRSASPMDGGLTTAALTPPRSARRAFVVLTSCPRSDPAFDPELLANALSVGGQQLDVIATGTRCGAGLATVARDSGGSLVTAESTREIAAGVDRIAHELLAEYQVSFRLARGSDPWVTLAVDAQNVRAVQAIQVADPPAPASHGLSDIAAIAVGAGVSIALFGVTMLLVAVGRRRTVAG